MDEALEGSAEMQTHFRKLEHMYLHANINQRMFSTTQIHIENGTAEISLELNSDYFHALGALHGSVYFKLLDDAAFFAASSLVPNVFLLTASFQLHFIRPVSEGLITARGLVRVPSKNNLIAESTLFDAKGREIAFGSGTFARSKSLLTDLKTYKLP